MMRTLYFKNRILFLPEFSMAFGRARKPDPAVEHTTKRMATNVHSSLPE